MSLTNLAVTAGHAVAEWRRRRKAYLELMSLDDRTLADIGIRRSQVAGVVYGSREAGGRTATTPGARQARPALHTAPAHKAPTHKAA